MITRTLVLSFLAAPAFTYASGTFSTAPLMGDADSGIVSTHAYTHAIDMGDVGNRTINGVVFTGGGAAGTNNYTTTGVTDTFNNWPLNAPPGTLVTGATAGLFTNFNYQSAGGTESLTLQNLRVGQTYQTTFYNAVWGGPRVQTITTSDGGSITHDVDAAGPSGTGSLLTYTFTAASTTQTYTFAPNQVASAHQYAFTNQVVGQKALFTDNFYAPGNPDTSNKQFNQAARQGGMSLNYLSTGNTQVGNVTGGVDGGNYLLTAFGGRVAPDFNFNNASSAGGLSVSFDLSPNINGGNPSDWGSVTLGSPASSALAFVNDATPHVSFLFRGNGNMEVWDGNTNITNGTEPSWGLTGTNTLHHFELLITDPTDQNPFDGFGQTDVAIYANGSLFYSFTKGGGGFADNYMNFGASAIAGHDNLVIAQIVPEPGAAMLAGLATLGLGLGRRRRVSSK